MKDCDFDLQRSTALSDWTAFQLKSRFHIENTKYIYRLPDGITEYEVPSYSGCFDATNIGANKPMPDKYVTSEFINSSFVCFGDEYGFSKKFISWHECELEQAQVFDWEHPGLLLQSGNTQLIRLAFSIVNDWNGPCTIWPELVIINPNNLTGDMRVSINAKGTVHKAPTTWISIFSNVQNENVTLTGETNQRVCIDHIRAFDEATLNGVMSGNVHCYVQFDLDNVATTYVGDIWLQGFNVYTFGGR
jgi:hypothetical protein